MDIIDIVRFLLLPIIISQSIIFADTAVLDPSLYLYPSPPLSPSSDGIEANELWTRAARSTNVQYVAENEIKESTTPTSRIVEKESMENAGTFWPRLHSIDYIKKVHVPVTFSISGNYGGYRGSGVIGNAYASMGPGLFGGKSALAGSGYGNYGSSVRVYSGNNEPTWSGWGNGKWGHYGKG